MTFLTRVQPARALRTFTIQPIRAYASDSSSRAHNANHAGNKAASETSGGGINDASVSKDQSHPTNPQGEGKGGDASPKTPDVQQQPTRSTGIGSSDGNAPKKD